MSRLKFRQILSAFVSVVLSLVSIGCGSSANTDGYYGKTEAPTDNTFRYITGSEPESLDPIVGTGQPEARIYMAIYDGLVEYHPKTMEPIPALAESWEVSKDGTEYLFNLRKNGKFSNGEPITAKDFVYSIQRAFSPEAASRNAYLGYYVKYSEAYNSGDFFIKSADGKLMSEADFAEKKEGTETAKTEPAKTETKAVGVGAETEFIKKMREPMRMVLSHDTLKLAQTIEKNQKLKDALKFKVSDIKNASAFVNKVRNGTDGLSNYLKTSLPQDALNACTDTTCDESTKQSLADGLNKVLDGDSIFSKDWFANLTLKDAPKLAKKITDDNKKREDENVKIDELAAKLTDATEKEAKLKTKKQPIGKLFYANKIVLEESFAEELEKSPLVVAKAEDLGVEAVDDHTVRIKLTQPAPFFVGLLAHQFFRVVHQGTIEKFGKDWAKAQNIVTSGTFKVKQHNPYDKLIVEKDSNNWDAENVKLQGIEFYPMDEATTMMNLYKAGKLDAIYNHTVPTAWLEEIKPNYKDEYLDFPEVAVEFYTINTTKAPMNNPKVREAFALAIDRYALAKFRKVTKPLADYTPEGIFPDYEAARKKVFDQKRKENNISEEDWEKRKFNPDKARKLLADAGYPVIKDGDGWKCPTFPIEKVNATYNTAESNKAVAEFLQSQWKQNLGLTLPLKNMEFKTFLPEISKLNYEGVARKGWVGDYMDPFTFLGLLYTANNDSSSGWHDPKYDEMLNKANAELDANKRWEMLAEAEWYVSMQQPFIPLQTQATNWIKKPYVKGFYPNPGTLHAWKFVYLEKDEAKWDKNVDNLMNEKDPLVYTQLEKLTSTQTQLEQNKKQQSDLAKVAKAE
jgi:oligopeptide transport system substrate-binding protein